MATPLTSPSYLIAGGRIGIRTWNRRRDRRQIDHWPPYSPALPAHWTASAPVQERERVFSYAVDHHSDSRLIGRISVRYAEVARIGIVLHPLDLGHGYGAEALTMFARLCPQLGLGILELDVAAENIRAVRCYQRVGFALVGETCRGGFRYLDMRYVC